MSFAIEHGMFVRRVGAGPEIVWIHGLGSHAATFDAVVAHPRLAGFTHVLLDQPGFGRSPRPIALPSLEETADTLAKWIGDRRPALVGHSAGGVIAQLVAERVPVRALVDVDGNLTQGDCETARAVRAQPLDEFVRRGFAELRDWHASMASASAEIFHRQARDLVAICETGTLVPRLAALDAHRVPWVCLAPSGHWVFLEQRDRFAEAVAAVVQPPSS